MWAAARAAPMSLQKVVDGALVFWVPEGVGNVAFSSRTGGYSGGPFQSLNLGRQTPDSVRNVDENRRLISRTLGISSDWFTLRQVHGARVVEATESIVGRAAPCADGIVARRAGPPVAVATADCLPLALLGPSCRAVVHAGWRGLCSGVIQESVSALGEDPSKVRAWIGPSIGPCHYIVGEEVAEAFRLQHPGAPDFSLRRDGSRRFDLRAAARWALRNSGVSVGDADPPCTFCDPLLYSHRRDGVTGRQAVIVW